MLRLYIDENIHAGPLVASLRRAGFDCLTVNEAGMRGAADGDQLRYSASEGRALYTCDVKDFQRLDREWRLSGRHHQGIVVLTHPRTDIGLQLRCFQSLANRLGAEPMTDRLEFLLNYR